MVGLNGYTISSGIISSELNDEKIVAIPLEVYDAMTLGYLKHKKMELSEMALDYLALLKQHIKIRFRRLLKTIRRQSVGLP